MSHATAALHQKLVEQSVFDKTTKLLHNNFDMLHSYYQSGTLCKVLSADMLTVAYQAGVSGGASVKVTKPEAAAAVDVEMKDADVKASQSQASSAGKLFLHTH